VRRLVQGEVLGPGILTRTWDGKTDEGVPARAGVYRVRIRRMARRPRWGW